jgi:hypothetical protein
MNPLDTAYPTKADSKSGGPNFEYEQAHQKKYVGYFAITQDTCHQLPTSLSNNSFDL